jgi:hypothetical protein
MRITLIVGALIVLLSIKEVKAEDDELLSIVVDKDSVRRRPLV